MSEQDASERCKMCGRVMDVPGDVASENCGGDCLACMADCGDPDCIAALSDSRTGAEKTERRS